MNADGGGSGDGDDVADNDAIYILKTASNNDEGDYSHLPQYTGILCFWCMVLFLL